MILQSKITQKKGKHIQIFADNCSICEKHIINVEIGKCAGSNIFYPNRKNILFEHIKHSFNFLILFPYVIWTIFTLTGSTYLASLSGMFIVLTVTLVIYKNYRYHKQQILYKFNGLFLITTFYFS
ncbi:MAG: hypothetical protein ACW967_00950 [Candidatus Hodarchaeales archaeon]|jgi:hypothetical protein